ncbi:hypothetical protein BU23DRAFT_603422 [Bimuria novae-zelandiae CBS 107.79]|uniref:Uncharacterized protein n=1 Tax=Bimuria novae-zelandiae CBS 107.79 TaxID=1447943 RepID=A0A6A5UQE5_9PLEO|nr:hypothetical protein BU23DRAFT_603422 [Bimuria novae-zelandiae CBS 107.79]
MARSPAGICWLERARWPLPRSQVYNIYATASFRMHLTERRGTVVAFAKSFAVSGDLDMASGRMLARESREPNSTAPMRICSTFGTASALATQPHALVPMQRKDHKPIRRTVCQL